MNRAYVGICLFQNLMVWKTDNLNKVFKTIVGAHMDWINGISWSDTNDLFVSTIFYAFFFSFGNLLIGI